MKIRELIEKLQACDPEAEVLLSLEFNRANIDPDHIASNASSSYACIDLGALANSIGERIAVSDNGDFVILEAQAGHISEAEGR